MHMFFLHACLPITWNYYTFSPKSNETSLLTTWCCTCTFFQALEILFQWELRQSILAFWEAHAQSPPLSELKMNYSLLGTFLRPYLCQNQCGACQACPIRREKHSGGRNVVWVGFVAGVSNSFPQQIVQLRL